MQIKIKRIENGKLPKYETTGSAGADCYARLNHPVTIKPGKIETIPLGFSVEIPAGYEMQIRGRSGLARKNGVQVFNSPGTIDSDYRGEVGAILFNSSSVDFVINPNDRIAQAVVAPVIVAEWEEVNELSETNRGTGGFGSTGVSENKENEKLYLPFNTIDEAKYLLNKKVVIDDEIPATISDIYLDDTIVGKKLFFNFEGFDKNNYRMISSVAYQRVKIDEHRFGKEITSEDY